MASSAAVRFDNVWISQVMSSGVVTSDSFSSGDGQLSDRQTEVGTHCGWHASYSCQISAGRLTMPGYSRAWVDTTSELANARVEVRSGMAQAFLVFRNAENGDYYRFGHDTGGRCVVERVTATSSTTVVRTTVSPQATDVVEVRQYTDGRVDGYVNGIPGRQLQRHHFSRRATG